MRVDGTIHWISALTVALSLSTCADSGGPELLACSDSLNVTVGSGVEPLFSWSPNCKAEYVFVVDSAPRELARWAIRAHVTGEGVPSPVRYGDTSSTMNTEFGPVPLVAAQKYLIRIYTDSGGPIGQAIFTP